MGEHTHEPTAVIAGSWEGEPVEALRERWRLPSLVVYDRVGSTNDVAKRLAEAGAAEGTAVLAETQTAGRGRGGSSWHDRPGASLLLSVVLRPRLTADGPAAPGTLPLRVGLVVAEAIERLAGLRTRVEWPNDVVVGRGRAEVEGGRKLAGILCEGALSESTSSYIVVGVGVNVHQQPDDFAPELRPRATSLRLAGVAGGSRPALAHDILAGVRALGKNAVRPLDRETLDRLAQRDALAGRTVSVDGRIAGRAHGIAADGGLLVQNDDGIETIRAGTVRPVAQETNFPLGLRS